MGRGVMGVGARDKEEMIINQINKDRKEECKAEQMSSVMQSKTQFSYLKYFKNKKVNKIRLRF